MGPGEVTRRRFDAASTCLQLPRVLDPLLTPLQTWKAQDNSFTPSAKTIHQVMGLCREEQLQPAEFASRRDPVPCIRAGAVAPVLPQAVIPSAAAGSSRVCWCTRCMLRRGSDPRRSRDEESTRARSQGQCVHRGRCHLSSATYWHRGQYCVGERLARREGLITTLDGD